MRWRTDAQPLSVSDQTAKPWWRGGRAAAGHVDTATLSVRDPVEIVAACHPGLCTARRGATQNPLCGEHAVDLADAAAGGD
jgi:hypothetical protein